MSRAALLLPVLLACAATSAWGQPPSAAPARAAAVPTPAAVPAPAASLPDLGAIPVVVLDDFEAAVRDQLEASRLAVERMTTDGSRRDDVIAGLGDLCLLYLRYELMEAAEPCLRQLRALEPADFRWPYYQTMLYVRDGDLKEAQASVEAALAMRPGDVPALLRAGDLYLRQERPDAAERAFAAALEREPASSVARFGLGRVAVSRGEHAAAAAAFEAALAGQPAGSVVHHHLGMAYRAIGDLERARAELAKNRQQPIAFPDPLAARLDALSVSQRALFFRGVEARRRGQPNLAVDIFEEILEADPDHAEAHYNLARALVEVDRPADAERHLRRAVELRPDFFDAHFNLAVLLGRRGADEEAGRHLARVVEIDPDHLPTRVLWAQVLAQQGHTDQAIDEIERVLSADPATPGALPVLAALAEQLARGGDFTAAAEGFSLLVKLAPEDARAHLGLGMSLILDGSYGRARAALEASLGHLPRHPDLGDLLARLLATCPDPSVRDGERAVVLAERVVAVAPTLDRDETLAMALAEAGRWEEAVARQRRVLAQEEASTGSSSERRRRRLALYEQRQPVRAPWLGQL